MTNNPESRYCPFCGQAVAVEWKHCPSCGKQLPAAETDSINIAPVGEGSSNQLDERLDKAVFHLRLDELDQAEDQLHSFLQDYPQNAQALALLGSLYLRRYKIEEAKQYLNQALLLEPGSPFVRLKLAEYWISLGVPSRALDEMAIAETQAADNTRLLLYIHNLSKELKSKTRGNVLLQPLAMPGDGALDAIKGLWQSKTFRKRSKEVTHEL